MWAMSKCCPADDLDQQDLPDIVNQRISELEARLSRLEAEKAGVNFRRIKRIIKRTP